MDWPNVTKAHRRCCTISSAFAPAAVTGGIWGVGGWGMGVEVEVEGCGGACPWLGEGQGMIEGQALGRGELCEGFQ